MDGVLSSTEFGFSFVPCTSETENAGEKTVHCLVRRPFRCLTPVFMIFL